MPEIRKLTEEKGISGPTTELNRFFGIEPRIDGMARKDPEDPGEENREAEN